MMPTPERTIGSKQRVLLQIERIARNRWRLVFLVALLAVVVASWLGSKLRLESDILRLMPAGNPQVAAFRSALHDFGSIEYLMVLLQAEGAAGPDELEEFADLYVEKLRALDGIVEEVEYRFQPDARFLELFYDNALLFLPPEQLPVVAAKLTDDAIRKQLGARALSLASPTTSFTEDLLTRDPLDLMPLFLNRIVANRGALKLDLSDGYYLSVDGKSLILLVKPAQPSQNLDFDRRLLAAAREAADETRTELARDAGSAAGSPSPVQARYGGNYAIALEESELIYKDARFNLIFSLFAVSTLYWLCYRRFAALLYSSVPLMVGQALTFALAWLVLGQLNSASSAFSALLMGLGTDFTIVMYARYVEERQAGATLAQATEAMVGETGLGVFTGAVTSAATFYAMCLSGFRGLFDLGFLIGSGIVVCGIAIVFLLPAMITWNEGVRPRRKDVVRKLHLQSFGLERLIPFAARHRKAVLAAVAVLTVAALFAASGLHFDDSINALRNNDTPASRVQREIATTFDASLSYMMAIASGATLDEAVLRAQQVDERLQPFVADGTIGSYDSVLTYLPPVAQQQRVIEMVRADTIGSFDAARVRAAFLAGLDENGFVREPFEESLRRMERFLTPSRPLGLDDLERRGLSRLLDRYIRRDKGEVRIVTYLFPKDPRWKRKPPPGLVEALSAGDARIVVTGTNVVGQALRKIFSRDILRSIGVGLLVVFVLLLIDFKSWRLTGVAMAQLLSGVALMLGAIRLLGFEINYVNAFVATMILGVGIDYGIHLIHRMHLTGGRMEDGLLETGKAVVLAALTNMAGFGTLMLGNYPALRSFGAVALLGSLACLLTSLTVVPALLARDPARPTHLSRARSARERPMSLFPIALILGVVEGITEFLPISSTGHLILASHVLGFSGRRAQVFEIFIQLGAILAVVWEYRGMLFALVRDLVRSPQDRLFAGRLLLAFVPSAVMGLALHELISTRLFRPETVAAALVVGAIAIFVVESRRRRSRTFEARAVDTRQALLIGACQCAALWPGFSRSAATILGGMLAGLDRRTATEFSFLLAIPTMFAATSYELYAHHDWLEAGDAWGLMVAFMVSFGVALVSLRWLLRYVASHDLRPFAWYRLALGVAVLLLLRGR